MNEKKLRCPMCGSEKIDSFKNAYWYLCRECGYNSLPSSDESKAISNFLHGADDYPEQK